MISIKTKLTYRTVVELGLACLAVLMISMASTSLARSWNQSPSMHLGAHHQAFHEGSVYLTEVHVAGIDDGSANPEWADWGADDRAIAKGHESHLAQHDPAPGAHLEVSAGSHDQNAIAAVAESHPAQHDCAATAHLHASADTHDSVVMHSANVA